MIKIQEKGAGQDDHEVMPQVVKQDAEAESGGMLGHALASFSLDQLVQCVAQSSARHVERDRQ